ncbi:BPL-N domain-containing protein [Lysobacter enzymogenes]|uniref:BPL-N domain-containing protein n=1 Tax=Lysobacter enzymogenes TaxID=69 RepID=UPI003850516D
MSRPALKLALKLALLALFAVLAFGAHAGARSDTVRVAVYRGPASCENCSETLKQAIEALGPNYRVDFVGAHEPIDITPANLARYDVYAQPGGGQNIPAAFASLGDARVDAIHDYVAGGGRYLGICMGAYLASGSGLGLVPHELESEVGRPGFEVDGSEDAVVAVRWQGRAQTVFYQDGPYLRRAPKDPGFRTIATYANDDIAAARYTFGRGVVVLSGPHPEADESWFEEAGLPLEDRPDDRLLRSLLAALGR